MPGRKSKKQKQSRNISGLRNQPKPSPAPSYNPTPPQSSAPSPGGDHDGYGSDDDDADLELLLHFDSMKVSLEHEEEHIDLGDDGDDEALEEWSGFHSPDSKAVVKCRTWSYAAHFPVIL